MLFGIAPLDPIASVAGTARLVTVALLAAVVPARRAARIEPSIALNA